MPMPNVDSRQSNHFTSSRQGSQWQPKRFMDHEVLEGWEFLTTDDTENTDGLDVILGDLLGDSSVV